LATVDLDWAGQIAALADSKKADFTIFNGDIVDDGGTNSEGGTIGLITEKRLLIIIGFPCFRKSWCSVPTTTFWISKSEPVNGTNLYYSFTYGDAVFISLNSEDPDGDTNTNGY
jgi:hypothetical protein